MALADTARLVASLELQDKFSRNADKFNRAVGGMEQRTATLGRLGNQVSSGIGSAVTNLTRLGVVGIGLLGTQVAAGIQSLKRLEEVQVATATVIESTGGVAGVSAEKVRELAESFESLNATMDDKVIQSAENMLLTFTNVRGEAFEPALEAILNLNEAMGGGEEGLEATAIQVGKALNDPIRGLTALRKVGVTFTQEQQDQIKALVDSNDLYGAQQIILRELGTEFGGRFAAAGTTATAKFAKLKDVIEDAQMALATAFLPSLIKVADKLGTFLSDPAVMANIEDVGASLAEAFDEVVEIAGNLPWTSIGDAFRLMGTGSKALLDAFLGLPPWVQTAVLTGWGLNKLTGGALTGIAGTLLSSLVKGVLGINAGVVNINAATVTGGPGGPTGGPTGSKGGNPLGLLTTLAGAAGLGLAVGEVTGGGQGIIPDVQIIKLANALKEGSPTVEDSDVAGITRGAIVQALGDPAFLKGLRGNQEQQLRELVGLGEVVPLTSKAMMNAARDRTQTQQQLDNLRSVAERQRQAQAASLVPLQQIAAKPDPSFTFNNSTTVTVDGRRVAAVILKHQLRVGKGPQEF